MESTYLHFVMALVLSFECFLFYFVEFILTCCHFLLPVFVFFLPFFLRSCVSFVNSSPCLSPCFSLILCQFICFCSSYVLCVLAVITFWFVHIFFSWILLYQYFCCLVVLAYILKLSKNLPFDMKIVLLCDIRMVDYQ